MSFAPKNPNDAIVGGNVKTLRTVAGLTQTDLANNLDLTFQQIQKYEKGFNRIGAGRMLDIANYLGCSIMDLYAGTGADQRKGVSQSDYRNTRQGVKLCNDMSGLSKATQRSIAGLVASLVDQSS